MKLVIDETQLNWLRRIGLALGAAVLFGGLGAVLVGKGYNAAMAMAAGAGIMAFFGPRWPKEKER